ncbi:MAG TPA: protein kinase [Kofleriaceae bacterium]|nr:protein kinase [Kofleriaceae bacterium]
MPDDKRTKIGTGPVRPITGGAGAGRSAGSSVAGAAAAAAVTPAPATDPPGASGHATSYLPPQVDPLLGQTLAGRYLIQKKLGEGGMGAVYLATHNVLEKQVALKVLHGEFARKADLVERFMQEAKAASRIRHENVIDISDFGHTPEGLVFFAMELLQGHDLHEEVARARMAGQLLPWERSKRIFLQVCAALGAAHALGIIHRDLKPENIYLVEFLGEPDFVKLLDFGIAKQTELAEGERKLTRTGMLFGTPEYMSPEQARGETVDPRVDVYAMGCILYQLVTGRVPFEAENFMGVLSLHLTEPPPPIPPEVFDSIGAPRALAGVITQALAKDRNQRFSSIDELARAVRRASGDKATGPVVAASVPAPSSTQAHGRVKTQWTGNLSVPEADAAATPRSKRPLVLGAIVLAGGAAAAAAYVATRSPPAKDAGGAAASPTPGAASATIPTPPTPPAQAPATPGPPAVPAAPAVAPLPFPRARIHMVTSPADALVKDLTTGAVLGKTPLTFELASGHQPRQFALSHKGYSDSVVELVPDQATIEYSEKLARGAPGGSSVVHKIGDPGAASPPVPPGKQEPGKAEPATEPGKGSAARPGPSAPEGPASPASPAVPPTPPSPPSPPAPAKPDDDSIDPVLKADPSRAGSAGGAPSTP